MNTTTEERRLNELTEYIDDASFDIIGENMTNERFANIIFRLMLKIRLNNSKVTDYTIRIGNRDFAIRVNNNKGGFVSVTNDQGDTGISNTMFYPFYMDGDNWVNGCTTLADMVNEAFYLSEYGYF